MILVDSSVWIDYFRGEETPQVEALDGLLGREIVAIGTIDTLIATRCIADGLTLLYSGRDFDPFVIHLGLRSALDEGLPSGSVIP